MNHYRNEYERKNVLAREDMIPEDARYVARHWAKESDAWRGELRRWQSFKQAQQKYHQCDRSELDLELENTDVTLVEALSKLNDWQEFQLIHVSEFHEAERFYAYCQQGIVRSHGAIVVASSADAILKFEEPHVGSMSDMTEAQDRLETTREGLSWVKSQWRDVIAEACSLIAGVPKLLEQQLEAKFERQTRAIYRTLQEKGARPSHAVHAPDKNASLPQRIQHWVSESSALDQELWEWRIFMAWRRHIRDSGNMDQQGRRILSEGDSRSELFKDFVKYQQYGVDKASSWVDCWRRQARKHRETNARRLRCKRGTSLSETIWWNNWAMHHHDDDNEENEVPEAKEAEAYAVQSEGNVSAAAERLEESKQKLQDILAEAGPPSTSVIPPTPPKSPSPEDVRKSRRSSKQKGSGGNRYRRSKKEIARRSEANMANANTEQHALPKVSLGSDELNEDDEDTQMSNDAEDPSPIEITKKLNQKDSEDAVMSDAEDRFDQLPSSPPSSHPRPIPQMDYTNVPSSSSPSPISRRTRSATKADKVPSGKVLKKSSKKKTTKKAKVFTEQQQMALLNAVLIEQISSPPRSRPPKSRKTRPAKELGQYPSRKIHKTSNKAKPRKKAKTFTEEQTQMLLNAAASSCHSIDPTSPEKPVVKTCPTPHTSANSDTEQSPGSPSLTSDETLSAQQLDHISSGKPHNNLNQNKSRKKAKTLIKQQKAPALTNAASASKDTEQSPGSLSLTSDETLSAKQLDHIPSGKPHNDLNQNKSRKKAKNLTKQQKAPALTNAASASCPSTNPHTLRRSERLKKKAAAGNKRA